jgi:hypothetical protein
MGCIQQRSGGLGEELREGVERRERENPDDENPDVAAPHVVRRAGWFA